MTYDTIKGYDYINEVDSVKVLEIAESIRKNGWVGAPMLVINGSLITGSHRLAALNMLDKDIDYILNDGRVFTQDIAIDVTDEVEAYFRLFFDENGYYPDLDFGNIGPMFAGTWVEEYKYEIEEW